MPESPQDPSIRYATADSARAAIDADVEAAHERAARAARYADEMMALTAEGSSERGQVRVSVNVDGLVTGVSISDELASHGGRRVTAAVLTALSAAMDLARRRADQVTDATWSDEPATAAFARAELDSNFQSPPPPDEPKAARRATVGTW